jgi:hypothetical protein
MRNSLLKISLLLSLFTLSLEAYPKIINFDIKQRDKKVELVVSFDERYEGSVATKSVNSFKKIILNGVVVGENYTKELSDNSLVGKIDIFSFDERVDIILSLLSTVDISYTKIDDGFGIVLQVEEGNGLIESDGIVTEGQSAFSSVSSEYIVTLLVLLAIVIALFVLKKRVEGKREEMRRSLNRGRDESSLGDMDLLLGGENKKDISLLENIRPPQFDFKKKKKPRGGKSGIVGGIGDEFQFGNPPVKEKRPFHTKSRTTSPKKRESRPPAQQDAQTSILFEEETEIGKVVVLQIGNVRYIMVESNSGNVTLLDKEVMNTIPSNREEFKEDAKEKIANIRREEEDRFHNRDMVQKERTEEKAPKRDVPQPRTAPEPEDSHIDESDELKDLFKDSPNLKI